MSRRVSTLTAIAIALPSLLAGMLLGILLRSQSTDAAAGPTPRLVPRATAPASDPVRVAALPPAEPPALPKAAAPDPRPKTFQAAWGGIQEWLRGFDLKTMAGRQKVPPDELRKRSAVLQQSLLSDPEGYLAVLRAPENDDLSQYLLSLLCQVVGIEGGYELLPLSQYPKPILDGVRELLRSGSTKQKLGILALVQRGSMFKEGHLFGEQALVERCGALLSDPDPMVRTTAVQVLQQYAPKQEDRRFEVLQDVWRTAGDPTLRATCLSTLSTLDSPAAREFLLKALNDIAADGSWTKDVMLQWSAIHAVQARTSTLKPEEEAGYAAVCAAALRSVPEPQWYQGWMVVSLRFPLARTTPLLEQAEAFAPNAELKASARRVIDQIRAGETRFDKLQTALRKQP
jgi:HEAT repeats